MNRRGRTREDPGRASMARYEWSENKHTANFLATHAAYDSGGACIQTCQQKNSDAYTIALLKLYSSIIVCFVLHVSTTRS